MKTIRDLIVCSAFLCLGYLGCYCFWPPAPPPMVHYPGHAFVGPIPAQPYSWEHDGHPVVGVAVGALLFAASRCLGE